MPNQRGPLCQELCRVGPTHASIRFWLQNQDTARADFISRPLMREGERRRLLPPRVALDRHYPRGRDYGRQTPLTQVKCLQQLALLEHVAPFPPQQIVLVEGPV